MCYGCFRKRLKENHCARDRNRTCDLRVTSALLYRLSYTGGGLNLAPVFIKAKIAACGSSYTIVNTPVV